MLPIGSTKDTNDTNRQLMKVHHEGRGILISFFLIFLVIDVLAFLASPYIAIPIFLLVSTLTLMGLAFNFFRSPNRHNEGEGQEDIIVAPADGKLVTIEEVYEPFLIQQGFIVRTPRGREVTELAYKHLGRSYQLSMMNFE